MNRWALMAVVFPILVLGAWVGSLSYYRHTGHVVRLGVQGFDPVDLLSGHYLTYTVNYGPIEVCPHEQYAEQRDRCACLAAQGNTQLHQATWAGACSERPAACTVFIKGICQYGRFEAHIERYYFPEQYKSQLALVPEKSAITVALRPSGDGLVTAFTVDGVALLDYVKTYTPEL